MTVSTLPSLSIDSSNNTAKLFNRQFNEEIGYKAAEVDAVIGYFSKRGFDQTAAINTALVLLRQASIDKIPAFKLIDTLKGITDVQLNNIVAQILNLNRNKSSVLGYRIPPNTELFDQRNIIV
jgi:hypothetical protein